MREIISFGGSCTMYSSQLADLQVLFERGFVNCTDDFLHFIDKSKQIAILALLVSVITVFRRRTLYIDS